MSNGLDEGANCEGKDLGERVSVLKASIGCAKPTLDDGDGCDVRKALAKDYKTSRRRKSSVRLDEDRSWGLDGCNSRELGLGIVGAIVSAYP